MESIIATVHSVKFWKWNVAVKNVDYKFLYNTLNSKYYENELSFVWMNNYLLLFYNQSLNYY